MSQTKVIRTLMGRAASRVTDPVNRALLLLPFFACAPGELARAPAEPESVDDAGAEVRDATSLTDGKMSADVAPPPHVDGGLQSDPKNCGWIGHDCRGLACHDGMCESELVSKACDPTGYPLLPDQCGRGVSVSGLVVEDGASPKVSWSLSRYQLNAELSRVYTSVGGSLRLEASNVDGLVRVGAGLVVVNGSSPFDIVSLPGRVAISALPHTQNPVARLSVGATGELAWIRDPSLRALDFATGVESELARGSYVRMGSQQFVVETIQDYAFTALATMYSRETFSRLGDPYVDSRTYAIVRADASGASPQVLVTSNEQIQCVAAAGAELVFAQVGPVNLATSERRMFAVRGDGVKRQLGMLPRTVDSPRVGAIRVLGDSVYLASYEGLYRGPLDGSGPFVRVSKDRLEDPVFFANERSLCGALANDAHYLYFFVKSKGEIRRVAR